MWRAFIHLSVNGLFLWFFTNFRKDSERNGSIRKHAAIEKKAKVWYCYTRQKRKIWKKRRNEKERDEKRKKEKEIDIELPIKSWYRYSWKIKSCVCERPPTAMPVFFYAHFEGGGAYECAQIKLIQLGNRRHNGSRCKKDRRSLCKEPSESKKLGGLLLWVQPSSP